MLSPSSTRVITAAHATRVHLPMASATTPGRPRLSHEPKAPGSPIHDGGPRDEEEARARLRTVPLDIPLLCIKDELVRASSPHTFVYGLSLPSPLERCESAQPALMITLFPSLMILGSRTLALWQRFSCSLFLVLLRHVQVWRGSVCEERGGCCQREHTGYDSFKLGPSQPLL